MPMKWGSQIVPATLSLWSCDLQFGMFRILFCLADQDKGVQTLLLWRKSDKGHFVGQDVYWEAAREGYCNRYK